MNVESKFGKDKKKFISIQYDETRSAEKTIEVIKAAIEGKTS